MVVASQKDNNFYELLHFKRQPILRFSVFFLFILDTQSSIKPVESRIRIFEYSIERKKGEE